MPCGQKNSTSEISHSQTVTPPFAAMLGTTFRLNTATTNSAIRSQRPSERLRCTVSTGEAIGSAKEAPKLPEKNSESAGRSSEPPGDSLIGLALVRGNGRHVRLFLRLGQCRRHLGKRCDVPVDVRFRVGD